MSMRDVLAWTCRPPMRLILLVTAILARPLSAQTVTGGAPIRSLAAAEAQSLATLAAGAQGQAPQVGKNLDGHWRTLRFPAGTGYVGANAAAQALAGAGAAGPLAGGAAANALTELTARGFMQDFAAVFGLPEADQLAAVRQTQSGPRSYVRFQQTYGKLPVFGAAAVVQVSAGLGVTAAMTDLMRSPRVAALQGLKLRPTLTKAEAQAAACKQVAVAHELGLADVMAMDAVLSVYDPEVVGNQGAPQLVYRCTVGATNAGVPVADVVLVNAHTGAIALTYPLINAALNRVIYDAQSGTVLPAPPPGNPSRSEGVAAVADGEVNSAYDHLGDTYNFYFTKHGRDSIDGFGMTMRASVHYGTVPNAFWNPLYQQVAFADGFPAADDVVAHEVTHGVTEHSSGLIYLNESGAINESFSDAWGEWIDQWNGTGTDTPEVKWQLGEDAPGGAVRYMQDPPKDPYNDPDRYLGQYWVSDGSDLGGVHTNSGVNNKLVFLLTDGTLVYTLEDGRTYSIPFNTKFVTPMGMDKVAALYYEAQTNLLTESADYLDLGNALIQAGVNIGLTTAEQDNVLTGMIAVELPNTNVSGFSASNPTGSQTVTLSWNLPQNLIWQNVTIVRRHNQYPLSPTDGTVVYSGTGTSCTDTRAIGAESWYAAFATYARGIYSIPRQVHLYAGVGPLGEALDNTQYAWPTTGSPAWFGQTTTTHDDVDAAQSGAIPDGAETSFGSTITGPVTVGFWLKTSCEQNWDFLRFRVDGVDVGTYSGESPWQYVAYPLPAGTHTVEWYYTKDASGSAGSDAVWVDLLTIMPLDVAVDNDTLTFTTSDSMADRLFSPKYWFGQRAITHDGVDAAQSGYIGDGIPEVPPPPGSPPNTQPTPMIPRECKMSTTIIGPCDVTFWWRASCEAGSDYLILRVNGRDMDAISGNTGWRFSGVTLLTYGSYTVEWVYSKDDSGSDWSDCGWVDEIRTDLSLPMALDYFDTTWTTSGDAAWFGQNTITSDGQDAARSGAIADNQRSVLSATVPGPTLLSFWWKVSCDPNGDFLRFLIDGAEIARITGDVDWTNQTYTVPAGTHTLTWEYSKDSGGSAGLDAGFVDFVEMDYPDIALVAYGLNIADGDTTPRTADGTDFGSTAVTGGAISRSFDIRNLAVQYPTDALRPKLDLTGTPLVQITGTNAADFTVQSQPSTPLIPLGRTSFTVLFDPSGPGLRTATVVIPNNDTDEGPFEFAIQGTGLPEEINVTGLGVTIADGDATPSAADDTLFAATPLTGSTLSHTFTIQNVGTGTLALNGSPRVQVSGTDAADFTVTTQPTATVAGGGSTTFTVRFDPSALGVRNAILSIINSDSNETPYDFAIQGSAIEPEMDVKGNGVSIADGDSTPSVTDGTDYGPLTIGDTLSRNFIIYNTGVAILNLTGGTRVTVSGPNAADFRVTTQPAASVATGASSIFTVAFTPSGAGARLATLTIANTDTNEAPYDFSVMGNGAVIGRAFLYGDMETGAGSTPTGWTSIGTAAASWATDAARSPTHSLKLVGDGSDSAWIGTTIAPPEPRPYTLTVGGWSRASGVVSPTTYGLALSVVFEDGSTVWYNTNLGFSSGTRTWENRAGTVTFTKRVKLVTPYLQFRGTGTVWFDDVTMKLQPTVTRNFMADDAASLGGSTPAAWSTFGQTLTSTTGWATDQKKSGARSLKVTTTGGTNGGWANTPFDFVEPYPQTFTLRGWSRASGVAANATYALYVYFVYDDNTTATQLDGLRFAPGTHDWQEVYKQVSLPKGVKQVRAYALLYGGAGTQTAWFDDLEVIPEAPVNPNYRAELGSGPVGPTDWVTGNQDLSRVTGWDTVDKHSGARSLMLQNSAGTNGYWVNTTASFSEPYPQALRLGGWSKANAVSASATIYSLYFIATMADNSTQSISQGLTFARGTHDWQKAETLARFTQGVKQVRAYCLLYGGTGVQTAWFDDVYALRYDPPNRNQHVEFGEAAVGPDGWATGGQTLTKVTGWATDAVHSGTRALKIVNDTGTNAYWAGTKVGFGATTPKAFTFRGSSRATAVDAAAFYVLYFLVEFDDGTTLGYLGDYNSGTGRYELSFAAGTTAWQTIEKRVTFAKGVKSVTPYVLLYRGAGTQTAWFDDIYVIPE